MAKLEQVISGDFYELLRKIERWHRRTVVCQHHWKSSVTLKVELPDAVFVFSNDIVMLEIIG